MVPIVRSMKEYARQRGIRQENFYAAHPTAKTVTTALKAFALTGYLISSVCDGPVVPDGLSKIYQAGSVQVGKFVKQLNAD